MSELNETIKEFIDAYHGILQTEKKVYIHVSTDMKDTVLPEELRNKGDQVLDISPTAVRDITFGSKYLEFSTSFNGKICNISLPYDCVICMIQGTT